MKRGFVGVVVVVAVQGAVVVVAVCFVGVTSLETGGGGTPLGSGPTLSFALSFFLFFLFLGSLGFLNETPVGVDVHVLVTRGAVHKTALVSLIVFETRFLFEAVRTSSGLETDRASRIGCHFARVVEDAMGLFASVPEEVPMTMIAAFSGFETARESLVEIGTPLLSTSTTKTLVGGTSMTSFVAVGLQTVSTHVIRTEKSRECGDDVVMSFGVEQNDLFFIGTHGWTESLPTKRAIGIDEDEAVIQERGCLAELREFLVTAGTWRDVGLVVEKQGEVFLYVSAFSNGLVLGMLVESGFGGDDGSGTTEMVVILDVNDGPFRHLEKTEGLVTRFGALRFPAAFGWTHDVRDG